jgi:hypothetical protein
MLIDVLLCRRNRCAVIIGSHISSDKSRRDMPAGRKQHDQVTGGCGTNGDEPENSIRAARNRVMWMIRPRRWEGNKFG